MSRYKPDFKPKKEGFVKRQKQVSRPSGGVLYRRGIASQQPLQSRDQDHAKWSVCGLPDCICSVRSDHEPKETGDPHTVDAWVIDERNYKLGCNAPQRCQFSAERKPGASAETVLEF